MDHRSGNVPGRSARPFGETYCPGKEKHFQFILEPGKNKRNYFEVSTYKERIRIKGNSYISMASGLDWYLKNYCGVSYANCDSILPLPDVLPKPQERTYKETYMQIGYTGYDAGQRLFWNWQDWEKEIDRMALSGINVCPVWTGTESVWKEFLSDCSLDEKAICQYLFGTDQAPEGWLKGQENLQKKIIRRMQNLGISPVYRAFTGTVPQSMTEGKPNIITVSAYTAENISRKETTISADDPLFAQLAKNGMAVMKRSTAPHHFIGEAPADRIFRRTSRNACRKAILKPTGSYRPTAMCKRESAHKDWTVRKLFCCIRKAMRSGRLWEPPKIFPGYGPGTKRLMLRRQPSPCVKP